MQQKRNFIANALELRLFCIGPLIFILENPIIEQLRIIYRRAAMASVKKVPAYRHIMATMEDLWYRTAIVDAYDEKYLERNMTRIYSARLTVKSRVCIVGSMW